MQYRRFGRTNLHISVLTFGAVRIPYGDLSPEERRQAEENAFLTMKRALEVGVNHFETARGYRGDCLPRCPLKLDVPALLRETHEMLTGSPVKRLWR